MVNARKFYDKITKDIVIEEKKKGINELNKGKHVSRNESMIDPYGLQPTPGNLYKSPFTIRIVLDDNGNEIKKELLK